MQTEYPAAQQYFKIVHINKIGILYRHFPYRQIQNMFGIRFRIIFHMQNDAVLFKLLLILSIHWMMKSFFVLSIFMRKRQVKKNQWVLHWTVK